MGTIKKILITGASGFVGGRAVKALRNEFEIITPSHQEFDITSADGVAGYIQANRPDAILHLAAISNTWYCEEHPEESYLVNVVGVENLARVSAQHGIKLVFFSSDQIYNGNLESGLLTEDMAVAPENHYGRHKLLAEERALEICPSCVALRATWMYDSERTGMKTHGNFVINFRNAIENGTPLRFATREFRGITWIEEITRNIPHTFDLPSGVYNFGAENTLNTYETALEYAKILERFNGSKNHCASVSPEDLIVADTERFPEHVRNISISMQKAHAASNGKIQFRTTLEGLAAYEQNC